MWRISLALLTVICSIIIAIATSGGVAAKNISYSTLNQEISLIDCTETGVSNGYGREVDVRCSSAVVPTVSHVKVYSGRPLIGGTYDSENAHSLRVFVAGSWYILGIDKELTAHGNDWSLDLTRNSPLMPGSYGVIVEVITSNRLLLRGQLISYITIDDKGSGQLIPDATKPEVNLPEPVIPEIGEMVPSPVSQDRAYSVSWQSTCLFALLLIVTMLSFEVRSVVLLINKKNNISKH